MDNTTNTNDWYTKGEFPPVGTVCLGHIMNSANVWVWAKVEVIKLMNNDAAVHALELDILRRCDEFKPIQTEREQWIDEMFSHLGEYGMISTSWLQRCYDAGLAKMPEDN